MDKPIQLERTNHSLTRLRPEKRLGEMLPAIHLVRTSWMIRLVGKVTFVALAISLVAMFFLPWQQTAKGNGTVFAFDPQQRPQTIASRQDGIIKWVRPGLREGSVVAKDEPILEIEPFAPEAVDQLSTQLQKLENKRESQIATLALAEQNVTLQKVGGENLIASVEKDVEAAKQKYEQTQKEVEVLETELAQKSYDKELAEKLIPFGLIPQQEYVTKQNDYNAAKSKLEKGKKQVAEFLSMLISKEKEQISKQNEIYIKNQQAEQKAQEEKQKLATTEKEISELGVKIGELGRLVITSPVDGALYQMFSVQGANTVKKGDALFTVVPQVQDLAVELNVAGRDMPLVHVGDKVRLQFQGWPAVQFVGWPSAAVGTFGGKVAALSPTDDAKGNFSVLVVPDPEEPAWPDNRYLRQGVRASGWILLKRVSLGFEIWRQLNGFPPVISDNEPNKSGGGKDGLDGKGSKPKLPKS